MSDGRADTILQQNPRDHVLDGASGARTGTAVGLPQLWEAACVFSEMSE